jgi:hypothetical protein
VTAGGWTVEATRPKDLSDVLRANFRQLCADLAGTRVRQRQKDNPTSRAEVARCRAKLDAVLDTYLELERERTMSRSEQ